MAGRERRRGAGRRPAGTAIDAALREGFAAGLLEGLHCVRVELRGEAMAETCFPGEDERWGAPLGERDHGPDTLHDMRSVSKSVVGLLYGIALDEGIVPPPETPLVDAFPEYPDLAQDPERRRITVGDALSMQMGLEWDETIPYTNPRNSEIAMELAPDRYRFALERPVVGPPGEAWTYSGGATALVARIVEKGAGAPLDAYAAQRLFDPLGIADFEWVRGADGAPSAASGLRLSVRGLAAIGRMIVAGGAAPDGTQVVSAEWLERAFAPRAATMGPLRYGYQWWLAPHGAPPVWVAALGNGGQRLSVNPRLGLVVAITAGRYNQSDDWKLPVRVIEDFVVPGLGLR